MSLEPKNKDAIKILPDRKIIHIDMDAFFASVEQQRNPSLKGKPVIVGGSPDGRGVVAAASYEARHYGVRSAMPSSKAIRLCPHAIFVNPDFESYKHVSEIIRAIFLDYTPLVEPLSLDEAYLDVSNSTRCRGSATYIAEEIRQRIFDSTGLTASAGISYNKFLAKMASDLNKPNGMATLLGEEALHFLEQLEVHKIHGVGKSTAAKLNRLGIFTGIDLKKCTLNELIQHFGKSGPHFYHIIRGIDRREVNPNRERKSLGKERTFAEDIFDENELKIILEALVQKVCISLQENKITPTTISIKYRYADFDTYTRSSKLRRPSNDSNDLKTISLALFMEHVETTKGLRLIGFTASDFELNEGSFLQLDLFEKRKIWD